MIRVSEENVNQYFLPTNRYHYTKPIESNGTQGIGYLQHTDCNQQVIKWVDLALFLNPKSNCENSLQPTL